MKNFAPLSLSELKEHIKRFTTVPDQGQYLPSIKELSESLLSYFPSDPQKIIKFWDELDKPLIFTIKLFEYDDVWIQRLLPSIENWSMDHIDRLLVYPSHQEGWRIENSKMLCAIPQFKDMYRQSLHRLFERIVHLTNSHAITPQTPMEDILWMKQLCGTPDHVMWKMVHHLLHPNLKGEWSNWALELSHHIPKVEGWNELSSIRYDMFLPDVFNVEWFKTYERVFGPTQQLQVNSLLYSVICGKQRVEEDLVSCACEHYPKIVTGAPFFWAEDEPDSWNGVDSGHYIDHLRQLWCHWMTDPVNRQECLKSYAPLIDPVVFDVLLAPVLSVEDIKFFFEQDLPSWISDDPRMQRRMLECNIPNLDHPSSVRKM